MDYVLDTHPLAFLVYDPERLSRRVRALLGDDTNAFLVPTMAILELQYLIEVGRIEGRSADVISVIEQTPGMTIVAFAETELRDAVGAIETRDPFDRTILATAMCRDMPIVTRDRWMKRTYHRTVW